jgi:hypothetical protein
MSLIITEKAGIYEKQTTKTSCLLSFLFVGLNMIFLEITNSLLNLVDK